VNLPRSRIILAALATAVVATAGACSADRPAPEVPIFVSPAAPSPSASPVAEEITLAFAGDVHFTGRTLPLLNNPQTAFGPYAEQLAAADFAMVNFESSVTDRGTAEPKQYHFRAPTTSYAAIQAAGIDLVSFANNHALDYGQVGLIDTLDSAKAANMPYVGIGHNLDEAYAPHYATVKGVKLAIIGLNQVHELKERWKPTATRPGIAMTFDSARAVAAVQAAKQQADVVIVYIHWGTEGQACPNADQKAFAPVMADAGADIIVGTHAHTLLADGYLGDTYVHYGLGNFLWYATSRSTDTGVLNITIKNRKVAGRTFVPGVVSNNGQPKPVTGAALTAVQARLATAAKCTGLAPSPAP
jgi:poly-gamma-glutamate synthesis protein (capsule biosynthesis protein)